MKKIMFLLLMFIQCNLYSQDSSALEFLRLYNKFRAENNLPPMEYSMELEEFAKERIMAVSKGLVDCNKDCADFYKSCPDRDLHFKFMRMAENYNNDSAKKIRVTFENAAIIPQYECYGYPKVYTKNKNYSIFILNSGYQSPDNDNKQEYDSIEWKTINQELVKEKDLPLHFLDLWINSPKHKEALLRKEFTHFGFKYLDVYYQGNKWTQGYWIAGKLKK